MNGKRRKTKDEKSYVKQQGIIGEVEKSFTDDVILWEKSAKLLEQKEQTGVEKYVENVNNFQQKIAA